MKLTYLLLLAFNIILVLAKATNPAGVVGATGNYLCELTDGSKGLAKRSNSEKLDRCREPCALVDCSFTGGFAIPSCQCVSKCDCCVKYFDRDYCGYKGLC